MLKRLTKPIDYCLEVKTVTTMAETLQGIRRRAGYPTVKALALALEVDMYRIFRFEAAQFKADEPGDQHLVDKYGELARRGPK